MKGILLCGGKSSRMGTDKALIKHHGKTCLEHTIALFDELTLPYLVSCREDQYPTYTKYVETKHIIIDQKKYGGPLRGLMTCFDEYSEDLFLLACDMPNMKAHHIQKLIDLYDSSPTHDVYIYVNNGRYEPLCAFYTKEGLSKIKKEVHPREGNFSFQELLKTKLKTKQINIKESLFLKNYNYKEDWM